MLIAYMVNIIFNKGNFGISFFHTHFVFKCNLLLQTIVNIRFFGMYRCLHTQTENGTTI